MYENSKLGIQVGSDFEGNGICWGEYVLVIFI